MLFSMLLTDTTALAFREDETLILFSSLVLVFKNGSHLKD
jgi:hypothetical protein